MYYFIFRFLSPLIEVLPNHPPNFKLLAPHGDGPAHIYHPPIHTTPFYQLRCPDANAVFLEGCDTHSHSLSEIKSLVWSQMSCYFSHHRKKITLTSSR